MFFFGSKCLTTGEQQYLCLGHRFSKHKMTGYAKNLVHWLQGMFSTAGPRRYFDGPQNKPGLFL